METKDDFYFIWDVNISGGDHFYKNIKLTYNLNLNKEPIEVEIISKYIDTDAIKKKGIAAIDVIDEEHINLKLFDGAGKAVDSARLKRASN